MLRTAEEVVAELGELRAENERLRAMHAPGAEVEALTLEQAKLGVRIQELESLAKLQDRELRAVRARYDELFGIALGHASLAADLMRHFAVTDEGSGEAHRG